VNKSELDEAEKLSQEVYCNDYMMRNGMSDQ